MNGSNHLLHLPRHDHSNHYHHPNLSTHGGQDRRGSCFSADFPLLFRCFSAVFPLLFRCFVDAIVVRCSSLSLSLSSPVTALFLVAPSYISVCSEMSLCHQIYGRTDQRTNQSTDGGTRLFLDPCPSLIRLSVRICLSICVRLFNCVRISTSAHVTEIINRSPIFCQAEQ